MRTVWRCLAILLVVMFASEAFAGPRARVGLIYRAPDPAEEAAGPVRDATPAPRDVAEVPKVIEVRPLDTVQEVERVSRHDDVTRFGTGIVGRVPTVQREGGGLRPEALQ